MSPTSDELAEKRTDWAEDRTVLANERTYAGWLRTGLTSLGVGLGFHAIFGKSDPTWIAKGTATIFILVAVLIFVMSWRNARAMLMRLHTHASQPFPSRRLGAITTALVLAALALGVVLWVL